MKTTGKPPLETLPAIGTVENPAMFSDGVNVFLCYQIAPVDGGGNVILKFDHTVHFEQNPMNIRGLAESRYPVKAWDFYEVLGSDKTEQSKVLTRRFWVISFNDVTVEIVFETISVVHQCSQKEHPSKTLKAFLCTGDAQK